MSTTIEWTQETWNPTTGCDRVSDGCDNCYALTMANRLKGMGAAKYQTDGDPVTSGPGFGIAEHASSLNAPLGWRKPRKVFVNSMSDLFHSGVSDEFIARVWAVMAASPQHTYQILTKRHGRMRSLLSSPKFDLAVAEEWSRLGTTAGALVEDHTPPYPLPNVWLGVSVEDQKRADLRIPYLLGTPAAVRFLSCEPLLGPVDLASISLHDRGPVGHWEGRDQTNALTGARRGGGETARLDWVIVGGESGPDARPMHPDWARKLRDQCVRATVPFFFKQHGEWLGADRDDPRYTGPVKGGHVKYDGTGWGSFTLPVPDAPAWVLRVGKKAAGRELDGRTWDQYPAVPA